MKSRALLWHFVAVWVLLCLLTACNSEDSRPPVRVTPTRLPVSPSPTQQALGSVPTNCPTRPTPRALFPALGPVLGEGKVWFGGIDGPHAFIGFWGNEYTDPYGWTRKLVWEVGPLPVGQVTIKGENIVTHQVLWFQIGEKTPSQTPVLDPQHPGHPGSAVGDNWTEWGSYIFIPVAGCYSLSASWPEGHWQFSFAAGSQTS